MRRIDFNKKNTRKSQYYMPLKSPGTDLSFNLLYNSSFIEDLHLGIMPIGGRSENPKFAIKLNPPSKEVEGLISLGLPTYLGEPRDMAGTVCNFIEEAVHILTSFGEAYYEIIYFYDGYSKIDNFMIFNIHNEIIKETFGFGWQLIPKEVLKKNKELKRFVLLPPKSLMILTIPITLGGSRKFKKVISQLGSLSEDIIPPFVMKDIAVQQQTKGYDFSTFREQQETFLGKVTQNSGWTARGSFSDYTLEFYQIYRNLKFDKTKAILREYVLDKLNKSLERIGNKMGFEARLELEGIPSYKDYDNYIKQLIDGSLQFSDAYKLMRVY